MATNIANTVVQNAAGTPAINLLSGDTLNLFATGLVAAAGSGTSPGVRAAGSNILNISGDIFSFAHFGIEATAGGNVFSIASTATVFGLTRGIFVTGAGNAVNNAGDIGSAQGRALDFGGGSLTLVNSGNIRSGANFNAVNLAGGNNSVNNSGYIDAGVHAVVLEGDNNTVVNSGTLRGLLAVGVSTTGGVTSLFNAGTIIGTSAEGVFGGDGQDLIVNNGLIQGVNTAISLDGGNDVYDGRNGSVAGSVDGGAGDDIILGGLGGEFITGGANSDQLFGGGGADIVVGGEGIDLILGGAGGDVIQGGLGTDLFGFNAGDNGDLIFNFNEGGTRDGFDLRGYFNATGYTGTTPRAAGIMQVLQNGTDTDVYLHGAFAFRIQNVVAAAIDDTYFLFQ